jgi:glycosyltransferase involved in cell wall biosynthesis
MEREVLRRACGAVAATQASADLLRSKDFGGPLQVIPYAVDLRRAAPQKGAEIRGQLGIESPVIGFVGRHWEGKGIFDLWEALVLLAERGSNWSALFVGDGPDKARLRQKVEANPWSERVRLVASQAQRDIAPYISACDIIVMPSKTTATWTEQLSRLVLEAMAWGVPVVASDSGSNGELLEKTGGGLIFPEGDPIQLAERLQTLISDPDQRIQLAQRGLQGVQKFYNPAVVAQAWRDFLKGRMPRGN